MDILLGTLSWFAIAAIKRLRLSAGLPDGVDGVSAGCVSAADPECAGKAMT